MEELFRPISHFACILLYLLSREGTPFASDSFEQYLKPMSRLPRIASPLTTKGKRTTMYAFHASVSVDTIQNCSIRIQFVRSDCFWCRTKDFTSDTPNLKQLFHNPQNGHFPQFCSKFGKICFTAANHHPLL